MKRSAPWPIAFCVGRWVAAILYPDAKVKETFATSEENQAAPKVKF